MEVDDRGRYRFRFGEPFKHPTESILPVRPEGTDGLCQTVSEARAIRRRQTVNLT